MSGVAGGGRRPLAPDRVWAAYPRRSVVAASVLFAVALAVGAAFLVSAPEAGRAAATLAALVGAWPGARSRAPDSQSRDRDAAERARKLGACAPSGSAWPGASRAQGSANQCRDRAPRSVRAVRPGQETCPRRCRGRRRAPRRRRGRAVFRPARGVRPVRRRASRRGEVRALTVRGLRTSPGASWATLERSVSRARRDAPASRGRSKSPRRCGRRADPRTRRVLGYLYARVPERRHAAGVACEDAVVRRGARRGVSARQVFPGGRASLRDRRPHRRAPSRRLRQENFSRRTRPREDF